MKVQQSQIILANHARNVYALTMVEGVSYEDLFKPQTWAHVASNFRKGFKIEVTAHDGSWYAELYVRSVIGIEVTVAELFRKEFDEAKPREESEYEIKWAGKVAKHRVIRKSDKAVLKEGLETRAMAHAWLKSAPAELAA